MSNRAADQAGSTRQPFRLLDLPGELLIPIVRSYRSPIVERSDGLVIYEGEWGEERYRVLLDLCLTHRDILPFAQEELFKRLDIRSNWRMDMLNRSIASSERCMEYAGRTESILLGWGVDLENLMESGAFNPRELFSECVMQFSILNRFQNLRQIELYNAEFNEALVLPHLNTYSNFQSEPIIINDRSPTAFKSVNLPNLRRLIITHAARAGGVEHLYNSIVPQLDHIFLIDLPTSDFGHILRLTTSLESLRIQCDDPDRQITSIRDELINLDVKEIRYLEFKNCEGEDWETAFESIRGFKEVVDKNDNLKAVNLTFKCNFFEGLSEDACDQSLAWWKGIKEEMMLICVRKGIEVLDLTATLHSGPESVNAWPDLSW